VVAVSLRVCLREKAVEPFDVQADVEFSAAERDAVYRCIFNRRDVRGQFLPDSIPDEVLARLLHAAHRAPSVGFMQPWNFIVVRDLAVRTKIRDAFEVANREAADMFTDEQQKLYRQLKLEGIVEAPLGICVTCDRSRTGSVVLGRTHQADMDLYSAVCAVQNLWLAARAESIGVGWVSIIRYDDLREALAIPPSIQPIAYLCVGYVSHFLQKPELESAGWLPRTPLSDAVSIDRWQAQDTSDPLFEYL
jgi:5,6-dimethylbenzimidazole synthase